MEKRLKALKTKDFYCGQNCFQFLCFPHGRNAEILQTSVFQKANTKMWKNQTEFMFDVMSLTVPAILGSFFKSSSTLRMELNTVA